MKNSNHSAGECREGGCARPPAEPKHLLALGQGSSADLVESGVGNLIGINPRSSVNQLLQDLGHFCVRPAVIGVGTFFVVPQTHAESFLSGRDRKSTRLNSSHGYISYAVFCLKKKNKS